MTLVAVGPLQNIGDLVAKHPDVVRLVKRVVLMSGSVGPNAWSPTPVAEWNVKLAVARGAGRLCRGVAAHDRAARFDDLRAAR